MCCVAGCDIISSDTVKILGITLDGTLSFQTHVNNVVRSCNFHLRALFHIRRSLPCNTANTTVCCIVGSKVDYCNSLLFNIPTSTLQKLQLVSFVVSASFKDHLMIYCMSYTGYQPVATTNKSIIK